MATTSDWNINAACCSILTQMKTVVTGASGHIGANLTRALLGRGATVRAMVHRDRRSLEGLDVETVRADVLDPDSLDRAFAGADVVYHLAAVIALSDASQMKAVNMIGSKNVVDACVRAGVRRLVHFSSIHAISFAPHQEYVDESCALIDPRGCSTYNQSKAGSEGQLRAASPQGLEYVILRPTAVVGPHDYQPSFVGEMLIRLARGSFPALVAGGFDWVDVRDVVEGATKAADLAPTGSDYLLSGHWASLVEIAQLVDAIAHHGVPKFVCPLWLAGLAAPVAMSLDRMARRRPLFTPFSIDTFRTSQRVRHDKATRELGYNPRPLRESVADALAWFDGRNLE
jgi:dihydroflavonol-4-reductase